MRVFLIVFLLTFSIANANVTIKERLIRGNPGDFIVTEQGGNYSILLLRHLDNSRLVLEEITVEKNQIDLKKINWQKWIENRAPGALSWTSLVINLDTNILAQCFSYLENQWIFIEKSDYLFTQLLSLAFRPSKDTERKRIGPAPTPGEIDRRKLWKPQLIRDGKKAKKADYEVLRAKWPSVQTRLSGCIIELYLNVDEPSFPFPYWMEVQHPHYTFKIRTIDSGSGITSPMQLLKL